MINQRVLLGFEAGALEDGLLLGAHFCEGPRADEQRLKSVQVMNLGQVTLYFVEFHRIIHDIRIVLTIDDFLL